MTDRDAQYREFIDALVRDVEHGQGRIAPERVRSGLWNRNAVGVDRSDDLLGSQVPINELLAGLSSDDREVAAEMLRESFIHGIHQALVALHTAGITPFETGYEGTPSHDFIGRLMGWDWPADGERF